MNQQGYTLWKFCHEALGAMKLEEIYEYIESVSNFEAFSEFSIELCVELGKLYLNYQYSDDYDLLVEKLHDLT